MVSSGILTVELSRLVGEIHVLGELLADLVASLLSELDPRMSQLLGVPVLGQQQRQLCEQGASRPVS